MNRILICEDNEDILNLMRELLQVANIEIEICREAEQIFTKLENFDPHVLLLDYWLGDVKVDDVISRIRQQPRYQGLKIVLISAIDNLDEVAAKLEVDKTIKKPFDIFDFQRQVFSMLKTETDEPSSNHRG